MLIAERRLTTLVDMLMILNATMAAQAAHCIARKGLTAAIAIIVRQEGTNITGVLAVRIVIGVNGIVSSSGRVCGQSHLV